jgi:hypothetical protein
MQSEPDYRSLLGAVHCPRHPTDEVQLLEAGIYPQLIYFYI